MSSFQDSSSSEITSPLQLALSALAQEIDHLQRHTAATFEIPDHVDFEFRSERPESRD